jgi:hypothetical protein
MLVSKEDNFLHCIVFSFQKRSDRFQSIVVVRGRYLPLLKIDLNACVVDKNLADSQYFKSINAYNTEDSDLALQQSIENDRCASEKRIQYNAKSYLLSKLTFYASTLQAKQKLLSDNQDMIINHLESIKTAILQKLTDINTLLNTYTF